MTRRKVAAVGESCEQGLIPAPLGRIEQAIYLIRGEKVILDQDLASLYGVLPLMGTLMFIRTIQVIYQDVMELKSKDTA